MASQIVKYQKERWSLFYLVEYICIFFCEQESGKLFLFYLGGIRCMSDCEPTPNKYDSNAYMTRIYIYKIGQKKKKKFNLLQSFFGLHFFFVIS